MGWRQMRRADRRRLAEGWRCGQHCSGRSWLLRRDGREVSAVEVWRLAAIVSVCVYYELRIY